MPFDLRVDDEGSLLPDVTKLALIAHALPADGATLPEIRAVLETQHGSKLSLDALHRVPGEGSLRRTAQPAPLALVGTWLPDDVRPERQGENGPDQRSITVASASAAAAWHGSITGTPAAASTTAR